MTLNSQPMFFLAANSKKGFISNFKDAFSPEEGWRCYIIKGGPGTGKSTLMKRVADYFLKQGLRCHLCPCSSDPLSLDGVIFPDLNLILLDGTAPHTLEPEFPGASEEIINLGDGWDSEALIRNRAKILELTKRNKLYHKKASNLISAAGLLLGEISDYAFRCTNAERAVAFGVSMAKKNLPKLKAKGREWRRYLGAITPKGHIFYKKTLEKMADRRLVIQDNYGGTAPIILQEIRKAALAFGHEIICLYCPISPERLEHIIIPALRLSFATSNKFHPIESEERVVHARRFLDMKALHREKASINYERRAASEMLSLAISTLDEAKSVHDELEGIYISAMDKERLNERSEEVIKKILASLNN